MDLNDTFNKIMGDWNHWLAELNRILQAHQVENVAQVTADLSNWGHIRHGWKVGQTPQEVAEWILERQAKYEVLESYADEFGKPLTKGKTIATDLTEYEANRMIDRLWDDGKVWWKQRCSTNQKESLDTAS